MEIIIGSIVILLYNFGLYKNLLVFILKVHMAKRFLLLAGLFCVSAALLAGPPRTRATSAPAVLRGQEIGQPFKRPERAEDAVISDKSPINDESGVRSVKRGDGRRFLFTVRLAELNYALFSQAEYGVCGKPDPNRTFFLANAKPASLFGGRTTLFERVLANLDLSEGGRVVRPFAASILTASEKASDEGRDAPVPSFDADGKFMKSPGVRMSAHGLGCYLEMDLSESEKPGESIRARYDFRYFEGPTFDGENSPALSFERAAESLGRFEFPADRECTVIIKGPSREVAAPVCENGLKGESRIKSIYVWIVNAKEIDKIQ